MVEVTEKQKTRSFVSTRGASTGRLSERLRPYDPQARHPHEFPCIFVRAAVIATPEERYIASLCAADLHSRVAAYIVEHPNATAPSGPQCGRHRPRIGRRSRWALEFPIREPALGSQHAPRSNSACTSRMGSQASRMYPIATAISFFPAFYRSTFPFPKPPPPQLSLRSLVHDRTCTRPMLLTPPDQAVHQLLFFPLDQLPVRIEDQVARAKQLHPRPASGVTDVGEEGLADPVLSWSQTRLDPFSLSRRIFNPWRKSH